MVGNQTHPDAPAVDETRLQYCHQTITTSESTASRILGVSCQILKCHWEGGKEKERTSGRLQPSTPHLSSRSIFFPDRKHCFRHQQPACKP